MATAGICWQGVMHSTWLSLSTQGGAKGRSEEAEIGNCGCRKGWVWEGQGENRVGCQTLGIVYTISSLFPTPNPM